MTGLVQTIGIVVSASMAIGAFCDSLKWNGISKDAAKSENPEHQEMAKDYHDAACYALYTSVGMSIIFTGACYSAYKSATKKN